jgi:hypothetical protein
MAWIKPGVAGPPRATYSADFGQHPGANKIVA